MPIDKSEFETYPEGEPLDETDVNLRAYFWGMAEDKLAQYKPDWTDEQVAEWDNNFTNEGGLMLVCSERDVDIKEYRRVLHLYFDFMKKNEGSGPIVARPITYP